jgi:hypothetical protein
MSRWKAEDLTPEMRARIVGSPHQPVSPKGPAAHKYCAKEVWVDNIRFSSKLEAQHYKLLKLLKTSGEIRYFLRQVKFHLPGTTHLVDWMVVLESCEPVYLDSKGYDLPMGRLKRKQVLELYGVQIHVWTSPAELPQCLKREKAA